MSILLPTFWRKLIGSIVPPLEHSVSWHDAIRMKRLVCHAIGILLVV